MKGRNMYSIFIPSKGRPIPKLLFRELPHAEIVVEPNEEEIYRRYNPEATILVLPENDRGIAYARNHILKIARQRRLGFFWMLDDDIYGFYERADKKSRKISACEALIGAEEIINATPNIAQASLEYTQFAWCQSQPFSLNKRCDVATCINAFLTREISYREKFNLKEDRDFTMQVLSSGLKTMRVNKYSFDCPANGSNSGGLKAQYDLGWPETKACQYMEEYWGPKICRIVKKKSGRTDLRIKWGALRDIQKVAMPDDSQQAFYDWRDCGVAAGARVEGTSII